MYISLASRRPFSFSKLLLLTSCAAFFAALPAAAVPVSVRVVDDAGKPLKGARVWFEAAEEGGTFTATTDESGTARSDLPPDAGSRWLGNVVALFPGKALGGTAVLLTINKQESLPAEIKLGPAITLTGLVSDANGKPVQNALVRLEGLLEQKPEQRILSFISIGEGPAWDAFAVKTDAAGRWTFDYLPPSCTVNYTLLDPRFVRVRGQTPVGKAGTNEAPLFLARPGGKLSGHLYGMDGKPLANTQMVATADGQYDRATTGPDGAYFFTRLGTGSYKVNIYNYHKVNGALVPRTGVKVTEGSATTGIDMRLTAGALVQGQVTDAGTGAPIAGVLISAPGKSAKTGADGKYSMRAAPMDGIVYVMGKPLEYRYPKDGSPSKTIKVSLKEGDTKKFDFKLAPAFTLSGKALDEAGQAVKGVTISTGEGWRGQEATTDDNGNFTINGLENEVVGLVTNGDWTVIEPRQLQLPTKQPITVRLKHTVNRPLSGRVVDESGRPVEDATVEVHELLMNPTGSGIEPTYPVQTDADGRWTLKPERSDSPIRVSAKKEGYRLIRGGEVLPVKQILAPNGNLIDDPSGVRKVADIVLSGTNFSISGRVVDEKGAPVANAWVWAPDSGTKSGPDGAWTLKRMTARSIEVIATDGKLFGSAQAADSSNSTSRPAGEPLITVDIVLKPIVPSPATAEARQAFQLGVLEERGKSYSPFSLSTLALSEPEAALKLAARAKPDQRKNAVLETLQAFLEYDSGKSPQRVAALLKTLPIPLEGRVAIDVATEIAPYLPDEAEAIYARERPKLGTGDENEYGRLAAPLHMAALAARLGKNDEAIALAEPAVEAAVKYYLAKPLLEGDAPASVMASPERNLIYLYSDGLAPGGTELVAKTADKLPEDIRAKALAYALPTLARIDPEGVTRIIATLREEANETQVSSDYQSESSFNAGLMMLIRKLGKDDPAEALRIARSVTSRRYRGRALALAASFQPEAEQDKLLQEAFGFETESARSYERFPIVRRAISLRPALGAAMARELAGNLLKDNDTTGPDDRGAVNELAWLLAPEQPGRARYLLEQEWYRRRDDEAFERGKTVLAMGRADWKRALEMAASFKPKESDDISNRNIRERALNILAQWIVAPPEVRDNASMIDSWMVGIRNNDLGP